MTQMQQPRDDARTQDEIDRDIETAVADAVAGIDPRRRSPFAPVPVPGQGREPGPAAPVIRQLAPGQGPGPRPAIRVLGSDVGRPAGIDDLALARFAADVLGAASRYCARLAGAEQQRLARQGKPAGFAVMGMLACRDGLAEQAAAVVRKPAP